MATKFEIMVHTPKGAYVRFGVGQGDIIYLDGKNTGYMVKSDGHIYTTGGRFVSKDSPEDVMRALGKIRKK